MGAARMTAVRKHLVARTCYRQPMTAARCALVGAAFALLISGFAPATHAQDGADAPAADWRPLFNGRNLDGWTPKIRRHPAGENFANTFRVVDGLLTVSYDGYTAFEAKYGHLFFNEPFSHYRLRVEYRFIGEQAPGAEAWARRNSGVMLHSQAPSAMPPDQDFPISIEFQFLGGFGDGGTRTTGNLCTPGTHVVYRGARTEAHCMNSSSPTIHGDEWVVAEALVLGDQRFVHYINGAPVIEYGGTIIGGGVVSGHDPAMKRDGEALASGYISLQSESHPVQFRRVEILNLKGCMDRTARNYKAYYVEPDPQACSR